MEWDVVWTNWAVLASGLITTIELLAGSVLIGLAVSIPLAFFRVSRSRFLSMPVAAFTFVIRGTPVLVLLYLMYFGLAQFDFIRSSFAWSTLSNSTFCAIATLGISTAGYTIEIFAGCLRNIPHGEVEAAVSFGMRPLTIYSKILVPSMFRRALPQYANEIILLLHATSLVSLITVVDLTGAARAINALYYVAFEPYLTIGVIYLVISIGIQRLFKRIEARFLKHLAPRMALAAVPPVAQPN
jgi:arginine/ornithine transport system permease protein